MKGKFDRSLKRN
ncbi:hypothetical protein F383_08214 [Gossypium arboreum]|uniref:Uncharacterized protein n=1 Tax=Gossypium arboreum TaxID=29729 RepID=A0A0B0P0M2_GOSAR|nr:hypothetical protein F383_08214 [Gossypium arboreum]